MGSKKNLKSILNCVAGAFADNYKRISFLLLAGLALSLRIHHLDYESLWMDEIRQTSYYANSLTEIIVNAATQNQPPVDYWIGHFVQYISNSDFAVRMPAALFGTGQVLLLTLLISQISTWPVACGFGVIFAFLPFNLYYSQEARPYAISVFLFLCIFWTLNRFLSVVGKQKLITASALLLLSTIFLHSRALSPLVITVCLLLILVCFFLKLMPVGVSASEIKGSILLSCGAFSLALLFYLPSLKFILINSKRMVPDSSLGLNAESVISTITNLDLVLIWQTFVVQSEPITYPLLFLICLSPVFGWYLRLHQKNTIWILSTILWPVAITLNLIIFQSKSNMPFRPSYASYLLPLTCILGAVSLQGLWTLSTKVRLVHLVRTIRSFIWILAALFTLQTAMAAMDYKANKRKTDWRGAAAFLTENYDNQYLLIFDSFSPYGSWEPTFYGFPKYFYGRSPIDSIGRIPFNTPKMAVSSLTPVLILFQWREYNLTSRSPYPILSVPDPALTTIDYGKICRDPGLICTEFTGFSLIQLRNSSNNLAHDLYGIIEIILLHSSGGSWNVELHLAAAALACATGLNQCHDHLMQAEGMVSGEHLLKVKDIVQYIRQQKKY